MAYSVSDSYDLPTINYKNCFILDGYSIAGPKEKMGRLGEHFDLTVDNDKFGEDTFEKGERKMFSTALQGAVNKAGICESDIDAIIGGDLLNQIVSTAFATRSYPVPFLGLYNACGTFVESLVIGAMLVDNYVSNVACISGSHFSTAERQYRFPLELGVFRSPHSQWTATGAGCTIMSNHSTKPCARITKATMGRVVDYGIKDINNMGAAMAPAGCDTLLAHLNNTQTKPSDYDLILTGDLGKLGGFILRDLASKKGVDIEGNYMDCGASLYYPSQKTYMGGSGAACSALVFNSTILNQLHNNKINKILFIGTGALMSPTTSFQGDSIPSIAHCVQIEYEEGLWN